MKPIPENLLRHIDPKDRQRMGKTGRTYAEVIQDSNKKMEKELQRDITNLLKLRDIWIGKSKFGVRTTFTAYAPDFLFVWEGRPYGFEVKVGKEEPSMEQINCHCQMRRNGWLVFVIRSVEQAVEFLDGKPQVLK